MALVGSYCTEAGCLRDIRPAFIHVQIGSANIRRRDLHQYVSLFFDFGIRNFFNTHLARPPIHQCFHDFFPSLNLDLTLRYRATTQRQMREIRDLRMKTIWSCASPEKDDDQKCNQDHEKPNQVDRNTIRAFESPPSAHPSSLSTKGHQLTLIIACAEARTRPRHRVVRDLLPSALQQRHRNCEIALWNSSACRYAHNKKDEADHQEQEEQEFCDPCRSSSNPRKPKLRPNAA
jgi:hypothetical protein